jgi:hypothetical protein
MVGVCVFGMDDCEGRGRKCEGRNLSYIRTGE